MKNPFETKSVFARGKRMKTNPEPLEAFSNECFILPTSIRDRFSFIDAQHRDLIRSLWMTVCRTHTQYTIVFSIQSLLISFKNELPSLQAISNSRIIRFGWCQEAPARHHHSGSWLFLMDFWRSVVWQLRVFQPIQIILPSPFWLLISWPYPHQKKSKLLNGTVTRSRTMSITRPPARPHKWNHSFLAFALPPKSSRAFDWARNVAVFIVVLIMVVARNSWMTYIHNPIHPATLASSPTRTNDENGKIHSKIRPLVMNEMEYFCEWQCLPVETQSMTYFFAHPFPARNEKFSNTKVSFNVFGVVVLSSKLRRCTSVCVFMFCDIFDEAEQNRAIEQINKQTKRRKKKKKKKEKQKTANKTTPSRS